MGATQLFGVWITTFLLCLGGCATRHSSPRQSHAKAAASSKAPAKVKRTKIRKKVVKRRPPAASQGRLSDGDLAAQTPASPPDIPLTSNTPAEAADSAAAPAQVPGCTPLPQPDMAKIRYLPNLRLFFTGLFDACKPPAEGYRKGFFWVGMGVPCTGGEGRIQVVGKSTFPKKVVFRLDNACPLALTAQQLNQPHFNQILGFPPTAKALALYPLDTIYWHFTGTAAAGLGNDVTIQRSQLKIWNEIHKGTKVPLRLVGKENSFKPSGKLFEVQAMLSRGAGSGSFIIEIAAARVLSQGEAERVAKECQVRIRNHALKGDCIALAP